MPPKQPKTQAEADAVAKRLSMSMREEIEDVMMRNQELTMQVQSLTDQLARAEAVVEKLPVTADGVPMLPGMKIWSIVGCLPGNPISEGVVGKIDKPDDYSEGLLTVYCGFDELTKDTELSPEGWYSTREAAIAARSEGGV